MKTRGIALALIAVSLCLAPQRAEAQSGNQDLGVLAVLLAPPAVASLICDIVTIATLTNGFAYRGSTITGTVLGGVTTLFSFLALAIGLSSSNMTQVWLPAGGVGIAFGLATVMVNLYGIAHPPPASPDPNRSIQLTDAAPRERARPPGDIQFYPSVWTARGGIGAVGTVSIAL